MPAELDLDPAGGSDPPVGGREAADETVEENVTLAGSSLPVTNEPQTLEARLDLIPTSSGVYLMKNAEGSIIYVGKAVNLRNRLSSYFAPNPQGNAKVLAMISHIRDFSYLLVENELEALVLESNLIKRYKPFYNILLKDDHDYPYLRVTMQEAYPRALKAYRVGPDVADGAKYYGPYLAGDLYRALRSLHDIFPMKTCRRVFPRDIGKERPCLNYYINKCIGPCRGDVSEADYRAVMQSVCDFLEGRYSGLTDRMKQQMEKASERLEFEQAAVIRDRLQALERLMERQIAVTDIQTDCDILGTSRSGLELCILKLELRDGKISGTSTFFLSAEGETEAAVVKAFVEQYYPTAAVVPQEVLLATELPDEEVASLERDLKELAGRRVYLRFPQRGTKKQLLDMAQRNARETTRRRNIISGEGRSSLDEALRLLVDLVGLDAPPSRIEAFDISNMGAEDRACGMVVFVNGKPKRQAYRRFKIKEAGGQDDYADMAEVISRRLRRTSDDEFGPHPDLILLDGGAAHVAVIRRLIEAEGLPPIPVAGMVKDGRHRTRGLALGGRVVAELAENLGLARGQYAKDGRQPEQLKDCGREQQLALLRFLTRIQDEAHRYAGQYMNTLAKKRRMKYSLEAIPGIGPAYRQKLMRAFKTIKAVGAADEETLLAKVPGLGAKRAAAVVDHFRRHSGRQQE